MGYGRFAVGDLVAVIGDNVASRGHRAGYNGLWSLKHREGGDNLFVPGVAGWNLEHVFDGRPCDAAEAFFEPRHAPMTYRRLGQDTAELHQPPTPIHGMESWTRFRLLAPHYIDVDFRCVLHRKTSRPYVGMFWASYINAPTDKSMYFVDAAGRWTQLCTQQHNDESTVMHQDDDLKLSFARGHRQALYRNISPLRYGMPLFYGLHGSYTWITMFDRCQGLRLTHSPSGGGVNGRRQTTNPAWDFQWIIPQCQVGREYGFTARAVLRPQCSRAAVLHEYGKWQRLCKQP